MRFVLSVFILTLCLRSVFASESYSYKISDSSSLGEIAMRLYGKASYWKKIGEWNKLKQPYRIQIGQTLILKEEPRFSEQEGNQQVLSMWRRLLRVPEPPVDVSPLIRAARQARTDDQNEAEDCLQDAEKEIGLKYHAAALQLLERCRHLDPERPEIWILEIRILILLNQKNSARSLADDFSIKFSALARLPVITQIREERSP